MLTLLRRVVRSDAADEFLERLIERLSERGDG